MSDVKHTAEEINDAMVEAYDAWLAVERVHRAGPAMLEVLRKFMDYADADYVPNSLFRQAQEVIAKASGETP